MPSNISEATERHAGERGNRVFHSPRKNKTVSLTGSQDGCHHQVISQYLAKPGFNSRSTCKYPL